MSVEIFLKEFCEEVPSGASNEICYRINANKLYNGYLAWCDQKQLQPISGSQFVKEIGSVFPRTKLSDFRSVWGYDNLQKEFDGIALIKCLVESWGKKKR